MDIRTQTFWGRFPNGSRRQGIGITPASTHQNRVPRSVSPVDRPTATTPSHHTSTGPLGTGIASRRMLAGSSEFPSSRMKLATIGANW